MSSRQAPKVPSSKVVLLGSSGFIGNALLKRFRAIDDVSVSGYNSSALDLTSANFLEKLSLLLDQNTTLIIAARARRTENSFADFQNNVAIITHLAQCLERQAVKKCVYFSSTAVYGDMITNLDITEKTPARPSTLYGVSKLVGECLLTQAAAKQRFPLLILRPCMVYGPGDRGESYGPSQFIELIETENQVCVFGDGSEFRDYIFINDLVEITIRFALGNQQGVYNVACGQNYSFQQILSFLRKLADKKFEVCETKRIKPLASQKIVYDKLLSEIPGFQCTSFEEGLAQTYEFFSSQHVDTQEKQVKPVS